MDVTGALQQIADIVEQVNTYAEKFEKLKKTYVDKINTILEDLETTINTAVASQSSNTAWLEMKVAKAKTKLQEILDAFTKKINELLKGLSEWFEKQINSIKINTVKSAQAKLGIPCDNAMAESLAGIIPSPSIDSLITVPTIEIELPDLSNLAEIGEITLPRL